MAEIAIGETQSKPPKKEHKKISPAATAVGAAGVFVGSLVGPGIQTVSAHPTEQQPGRTPTIIPAPDRTATRIAGAQATVEAGKKRPPSHTPSAAERQAQRDAAVDQHRAEIRERYPTATPTREPVAPTVVQPPGREEGGSFPWHIPIIGGALYAIWRFGVRQNWWPSPRGGRPPATPAGGQPNP